VGDLFSTNAPLEENRKRLHAQNQLCTVLSLKEKVRVYMSENLMILRRRVMCNRDKKVWICILSLFLCVGLIPGLAAPTAQAASRNIILFIGDGMGFEHVQAGRLFAHGNDQDRLSLEDPVLFPCQGQSVTILPNGTITDSATGGTALATGWQASVTGVISEDNGVAKTTILELAKSQGLRVGIVTTDYIAGATPGSFGAHEPSRSNEVDIKYDYLRDDTNHIASLPNVIFGGGRFDNAYIVAAQAQSYSFVDTRNALLGLDIPGLPVPRVLGLFDAESNTSHYMTDEYDRPLSSTEPDLTEMTNKALDLLDDEPNGFFLMVEGALIDKLSHSGDSLRVPSEVAGLDGAVLAALNWRSTNAQEANTLILITADHETNGLNVSDGQVVTIGTNPTMTWSGGGNHTAANVPVFATWPAALNGTTVDNTEIYFLMEDYLTGGQAPVLESVTVSGISDTQAVVSWTTREPATSTVEYGLDVTYGLSKTNSARVTQHSVTLTGLAEGTTYHFRVSSNDLTSNAGVGSDATFTTTRPAELPVIRVDGLVMKLSVSKRSTKASATVKVTDQNGATKSGVVVTGDWLFNGVSIQSGARGTTKSSGQVTLTSPAKTVKSGDRFTFRITNLSLSGYRYDSALNGVSEATIPVP
jgi:alkaline phosphatase